MREEQRTKYKTSDEYRRIEYGNQIIRPCLNNELNNNYVSIISKHCTPFELILQDYLYVNTLPNKHMKELMDSMVFVWILLSL